MKKTAILLTAVLLSLLAVSALAAGRHHGQGNASCCLPRTAGLYGCQFLDEDGDGICDLCGRNFVDEDGDGICDLCGCHFVDEDGDGICDFCTSSGTGRQYRFRQNR